MRGCGGAAREMPCEACGVQFSVFRRKRACGECGRLYCAACLRRGGGVCPPCRTLTTRPLQRAHIQHLKPRDLQCFLQRQNVSTRGCVEKEELVSLCVYHVNSASYRRRGAAAADGGAPFTLKGLTTNINDFLATTFNTQPAAGPPPPPRAATRPPAPPPAAAAPTPAAAPQRPERFITNPGGERDFRVPPPPAPCGATSPSLQSPSAPLDTADCFEVEDLDDQGWEFVTKPADPLPNDSDVLMSSASATLLEADASFTAQQAAPLLSDQSSTPQRAASLLELRAPPPALAAATPPSPDRTSLADDSLLERPRRDSEVSLSELSAERVEALSVRALKLLLARNRVEYSSCVERGELQARALTLLHDHNAQRLLLQADALPLEECCKICMCAPLECVLLECGHIAACTQCAKQLAECPICRRYVVRAVRCFRA